MAEAGCDPIIAVVPEQHLETARSALASSAVCVVGGSTRQASVRAGLVHVRTPLVVVHDAARPFASPGSVPRLLERLDGHEAAILARPVDETLKRVRADAVIETVDRFSLWASRTPQAFRTDVLSRAHERAAEEGFEATDDAQLIEHYGGRVAVVRDPGMNLKVTSADDLELARDLMRGRRP